MTFCTCKEGVFCLVVSQLVKGSLVASCAELIVLGDRINDIGRCMNRVTFHAARSLHDDHRAVVLMTFGTGRYATVLFRMAGRACFVGMSARLPLQKSIDVSVTGPTQRL